LSLLRDVVGLLRGRRIEHAVIGAAALAVRGVVRASYDRDLLCVSPDVLRSETWEGLRAAGCNVEIRRGDAEDPLLGVVRVTSGSGESVDVIVGRDAWQRLAIERSSTETVGDVAAAVTDAADLVLLKLYAGGPQDLWDAHQLLDANAGIEQQVDERIGELPADVGQLWERIRRERSACPT
jgi:hypothetical protein